jgi:hypothetical protein
MLLVATNIITYPLTDYRCHTNNLFLVIYYNFDGVLIKNQNTYSRLKDTRMVISKFKNTNNVILEEYKYYK